MKMNKNNSIKLIFSCVSLCHVVVGESAGANPKNAQSSSSRTSSRATTISANAAHSHDTRSNQQDSAHRQEQQICKKMRALLENMKSEMHAQSKRFKLHKNDKEKSEIYNNILKDYHRKAAMMFKNSRNANDIKIAKEIINAQAEVFSAPKKTTVQKEAALPTTPTQKKGYSRNRLLDSQASYDCIAGSTISGFSEARDETMELSEEELRNIVKKLDFSNHNGGLDTDTSISNSDEDSDLINEILGEVAQTPASLDNSIRSEKRSEEEMLRSQDTAFTDGEGASGMRTDSDSPKNQEDSNSVIDYSGESEDSADSVLTYSDSEKDIDNPELNQSYLSEVDALSNENLPTHEQVAQEKPAKGLDAEIERRLDEILEREEMAVEDETLCDEEEAEIEDLLFSATQEHHQKTTKKHKKPPLHKYTKEPTNTSKVYVAEQKIVEQSKTSTKEQPKVESRETKIITRETLGKELGKCKTVCDAFNIDTAHIESAIVALQEALKKNGDETVEDVFCLYQEFMECIQCFADRQQDAQEKIYKEIEEKLNNLFQEINSVKEEIEKRFTKTNECVEEFLKKNSSKINHAETKQKEAWGITENWNKEVKKRVSNPGYSLKYLYDTLLNVQIECGMQEMSLKKF